MIYEKCVDSLTVNLYYKYASAELSLSYKTNYDIRLFVDRVNAMMSDPALVVWKIAVRTISSMEYSSAENRRVCDARAAGIKKYLQSSFSGKVKVMPMFETELLKRDWEELAHLVAGSEIPMKDSVLSIIRDSPEFEIVGGELFEVRKPQLTMLDDGEPWKYILRELCPEMRNVEVVCYVEKKVDDTDSEDVGDEGRLAY